MWNREIMECHSLTPENRWDFYGITFYEAVNVLNFPVRFNVLSRPVRLLDEAAVSEDCLRDWVSTTNNRYEVFVAMGVLLMLRTSVSLSQLRAFN